MLSIRRLITLVHVGTARYARWRGPVVVHTRPRRTPCANFEDPCPSITCRCGRRRFEVCATTGTANWSRLSVIRITGLRTWPHGTRFLGRIRTTGYVVGRINAPVIWDWFLSVAGRSSAVVHGHGPFEACYFFITLLRPGLVNCPLLHTLQQVNVEIGC